MKMTLTKNLMWKCFLVLSFIDTVTRFSFYDDLSPYRIVAVVVLVLFIAKNVKAYAKSLYLLFGSLVYSTVIILFRNGNLTASIARFVHILFLYGLYVAVKELSKTRESRKELFQLIDTFAILQISIFFFEKITGFVLFQSKIMNNQASVFSWGINDFVVSIVIPAIIYIVNYFKNRSLIALIKFVVVLLVATIAGARASIIVLLFAFIISLLWFRIAQYFKGAFSKIVTLFSSGIIAVILLYFINPVIDDTDIRNLIFLPIVNVLSSNSLGTAGSIVVRTSAIKVGLNRLVGTYGFGVGLGNINGIIAEYNFYQLSSMHNILIEFIVELGWLMVLFIIMIIRKVVRDIKYSNHYKDIDVFFEIECILLFPLIATQSSSGVMSCYFFWTCVFYVMKPGSKGAFVSLNIIDVFHM